MSILKIPKATGILKQLLVGITTATVGMSKG